jgi:putative heme iron utilization protein
MASTPIDENPGEPSRNGQAAGGQASGGQAVGGQASGGQASGGQEPGGPASNGQGPAGQESGMQASDGKPTSWQARCLLRAARAGTLATSAKGQPYASLVTPSCMPDGSLLLLLSRLAEHTRHLLADPRCSVLVSGAPVSENPQTTPRVTVTGVAEMVDDKALKSRYLAVHPYATLYADFGDFATWRIVPAAGILVGGFARAFRLKAADFLPDPAAAAAILAEEKGIIAHCNQDHPDALAAIARQAAGPVGEWRMVTVDVDGFDLALGDLVVRHAWSAPVSDAMDVRRELVRLAQQARGG